MIGNILSLIVFFFGAVGVFLFNKHFINILIFLELMILACNMNFVFFSSLFDDVLGQIYCLMSLTTAAAESSIGLALLIIYYRLHGGVFIDFVNLLKG
jgi:NADH-quinone oxidoreductase subunit K